MPWTALPGFDAGGGQRDLGQKPGPRAGHGDWDRGSWYPCSSGCDALPFAHCIANCWPSVPLPHRASTLALLPHYELASVHEAPRACATRELNCSCGANDKCICFAQEGTSNPYRQAWTGADCSLRTYGLLPPCPHEGAFFRIFVTDFRTIPRRYVAAISQAIHGQCLVRVQAPAHWARRTMR